MMLGSDELVGIEDYGASFKKSRQLFLDDRLRVKDQSAAPRTTKTRNDLILYVLIRIRWVKD